jgi:hypothetical protein
MSSYPELEAAAEHTEKVMPSFVAVLIADYLLNEDAYATNDLAGLRMLADEVMEMTPLATIAARHANQMRAEEAELVSLREADDLRDDLARLRIDYNTLEEKLAEAVLKMQTERTANFDLYTRVVGALGISIMDPWDGLVEAVAKVVHYRDEARADRTELENRIAKAVKVIDDADAFGEDLDPDDVLAALKAVK